MIHYLSVLLGLRPKDKTVNEKVIASNDQQSSIIQMPILEGFGSIHENPNFPREATKVPRA